MPQPLFAGGPGAAQDIFLQELPSSLDATLRATASSAFDTNPANLLYQEYESFSANRDENSPVLSAEDARKRISDAKLKLTVPDAGIRESALNLLMESKYQEKVWQDTISRGPTGFAAGTARFVTGLGVSILDPINIASAFIPVVGEAKVASMLARAGSGFGARALVRAEVGAVEGFVGAAAVEPFVYGMAHDLQKDYTMADSLMNLAFGTVLGGGLHVGVGAIRDHVSGGGDIRTTPPAEGNGKLVSSLTPEQRMDTLKVALAQAVDGRPVEVDTVIRAYHGTTVDFEGAYGNGAGIGPHFGTKEQANAFATGEGGNVRPVDLSLKNSLRLEDGGWENPAMIAGKLRDAGVINDAKLAEFNRVFSDATSGHPTIRDVPERVLAAAEERQFEMLRQWIREKGYDSIVYKNKMEGKGDSYIALAPREQVVSAFQRNFTERINDLQQTGRKQADPQARILPEDARAANETAESLRTTEVKPHEADPAKVAETEKAALTEESQELKALEDSVEQKEPTKFPAEDAQIEQSETLAKAAEALARCQLRG